MKRERKYTDLFRKLHFTIYATSPAVPEIPGPGKTTPPSLACFTLRSAFSPIIACSGLRDVKQSMGLPLASRRAVCSLLHTAAEGLSVRIGVASPSRLAVAFRKQEFRACKSGLHERHAETPGSDVWADIVHRRLLYPERAPFAVSDGRQNVLCVAHAWHAMTCGFSTAAGSERKATAKQIIEDRERRGRTVLRLRQRAAAGPVCLPFIAER
jgi:hypothetical protein